MTRLSRVAPRLKQLLLMLSSNHDGEVVSAARAIERTLKSADTDWHELAAGLLAPARASKAPHQGDDDKGGDWHGMREFCLRHADRLRPREREFLADLGRWAGDLTTKQFAWLASIHARIQRQMHERFAASAARAHGAPISPQPQLATAHERTFR
jgi:hypothetical protein